MYLYDTGDTTRREFFRLTGSRSAFNKRSGLLPGERREPEQYYEIVISPFAMAGIDRIAVIEYANVDRYVIRAESRSLLTALFQLIVTVFDLKKRYRHFFRV